MAISDDLHDTITTRALKLQRVTEGVRQDVYALLRELERNLIRDLQKLSPADVARSPYQVARLEALLKQTRKTIKASFGKINTVTQKNLKEVANSQSSYLINEINAQVGVDIMTVALSEEQLTTIARRTLIESAPSKDWWSKQAGNTQQRFAGAVRQGMLRGETTDKIVQRVRGTKAANYSDGIMTATRREAEALVRTSVQTCANEATMQTYSANDDVINGLQWSATLDSRTTKICMALHGKVWRYDKNRRLKPVGHDKEYPGPTGHWNCRSTQVPILKSWDELAKDGAVPTGGKPTNIDTAFRKELRSMGMSEDKIAKAARGQRASMDGYVARDMSFDAWLKKKGTAVQDKMLGKARAKLWRDGKISTTDLINQKGRPLTVAELETVPGTPKRQRILSLIGE